VSREGRVEQRSRLEATPAAVWERVITPEGINHELMPLMRMTIPRGVDTLDPATVPLGERLFRSWVLLFGVIPFDYDDIGLVRFEPGRGFHERSTMLTQRLWEHERTLEPDGEGCLVTDRLRFEPRAAVPVGVTRRLVTATFAHRHRRLRGYFGGAPA
jgi:ligand-binding SRPBCC domain-containing protein